TLDEGAALARILEGRLPGLKVEAQPRVPARHAFVVRKPEPFGAHGPSHVDLRPVEHDASRQLRPRSEHAHDGDTSLTVRRRLRVEGGLPDFHASRSSLPKERNERSAIRSGPPAGSPELRNGRRAGAGPPDSG